jgi:hypothetical protein
METKLKEFDIITDHPDFKILVFSKENSLKVISAETMLDGGSRIVKDNDGIYEHVLYVDDIDAPAVIINLMRTL